MPGRLDAPGTAHSPTHMTDAEQVYTIDIQIDEAYEASVDTDALIHAIEETLRQEDVHAAALTLSITDDETVRALNTRYRDVDAPTDVLSFANNDEADAVADEFILPPELAGEMAAYLGDIIIAYPYAERQAAQYGNSVAAELRLLAVHGTLHLLGYDHDSSQTEAAMWAAQDAVLAFFGDRGLSQRTYDA